MLDTSATSLQPGDLIDEHEAAAILDMSISTLRNWRSLHKGPRFHKIGDRLVRYSRPELAVFIAGDTSKGKAA